MFFWIAKSQLKVRFKELVSRLDEALERLECLVHRAKSYRKKLYTQYLVAYVMGDGFKASMYISEVIEVERMLRLMSGVYLSLEKLIIRLTILSEIYELLPTSSMKSYMEEAGRLIDSTLNISLTLVKDLQGSSTKLFKFIGLDVRSYQLSQGETIFRKIDEFTGGDATPVFGQASQVTS